MSYSKTTWKTGDTITAQLLNHAEDGIAANDAAIASALTALQVKITYADNAFTADKTYSEMLTAFNAGIPVMLIMYVNNAPINYQFITGSFVDGEDKILSSTNIVFMGTTGELYQSSIYIGPESIDYVAGTVSYSAE